LSRFVASARAGAALAMIIGMLPMAVGLARREQNAPLARVIGGLIFALRHAIFVPCVFS